METDNHSALPKSLYAMLTTDIELKSEIISLFRKIHHRLFKQFIFIVVVTFMGCIIAVAYFSTPTHIDKEVLKGLKEERMALQYERLLMKQERQKTESVVDSLRRKFLKFDTSYIKK